MKKLSIVFVLLAFLLSSTGVTKSSMPNMILLWEKHAELNETYLLPQTHGDNIYYSRAALNEDNIFYVGLLYSDNKYTGKENWYFPIQLPNIHKYFDPIFYKDTVLFFSEYYLSSYIQCVKNNIDSLFDFALFTDTKWKIKMDEYFKEDPPRRPFMQAFLYENNYYIVANKTLIVADADTGKIISNRKFNFDYSLACITNKYIFLQNTPYSLICLDKETLEEVWKYERDVYSPGIITNVYPKQDMLFVRCLEELENKECKVMLVKCEQSTGKYTILATKSRISENIYFDDNNAIMSCADSCDTDYAVECIDLKTETTKWKYDEPEVDDRIIPSNNPKGIIIASKEFTNKEPEKIQKILRLDSETGKKLWEEVIPDNSRFNKLFLDEDRIYYQDDDCIKCYLILK